MSSVIYSVPSVCWVLCKGKLQNWEQFVSSTPGRGLWCCAECKSYLHTGYIQPGHAAGAVTPHLLISGAVCAQPFCFPKGTCGKHKSSWRDTGDDPEPDARDSLCVPGRGPEQARPR